MFYFQPRAETLVCWRIWPALERC